MMSGHDSRDELRELASALCDGEISRDDAQHLERLATGSPELLDLLLDYIGLHAELAWMLGDVKVPIEPPAQEHVAATPVRKTAARWPRVAVSAAAAVLLVGVIGYGIATLFRTVPSEPGSPEPVVVATLTRSSADARWSDAATPVADGTNLVAGQCLQLESGLALIDFRSGAQVILDGLDGGKTTSFTVTDRDGGTLDSGRLVGKVPRGASGLTIATPSAEVRDLGTKIGVFVEDDKSSEIYVLAGKVEVRPGDPSNRSSPREYSESEAVRVALVYGKEPKVEKISVQRREFRLTLTPEGPVETMRALVESDSRLLHHYPFQGSTQGVRRADQSKHLLDLIEASMHAGRGESFVYEMAESFDGSFNALRLKGSAENRSGEGVGLESQTKFRLPPKFTVELLLRVENGETPLDSLVASAVAFQAQPAGAMGVAVERGRLVFRVGESRHEGEELVPGHWYYVAVTFESGEDQTTVNAYLADLPPGDGQLVQVAENLVLEGTPAKGRLGIGMGYDRNGDNDYPWAGLLDEIAIYSEILDRGTLEKHVQPLVGKP